MPIIERTFAWLEEHHPVDEGDRRTVLGRRRIGNILYEPDGFEPVAVLDWEMAVLAPGEVDLSWFAYLHTFFQDLAEVFELPGLPDFLRTDDCAADLRGPGRAAGAAPRLVHRLRRPAVRHRLDPHDDAPGPLREAPMPEDPDDLVMHRDGLERLLARPPKRA